MSKEQINNSPPSRGIKPVLMIDVVLDDKRFQVREQLHEPTVTNYMTSITPGTRLSAFPRPLLWTGPGVKGYVVGDGFHRIEAAKRQGVKQFDADILTCSEPEAMIEAARANLRHGRHLETAERDEAVRRTITAMCKGHIQPSDGVVSEVLGIPPRSIHLCRERLINAKKISPAQEVWGRDGKVQPGSKGSEDMATTPSEHLAASANKPVTTSTTEDQDEVESDDVEEESDDACRSKPALANHNSWTAKYLSALLTAKEGIEELADSEVWDNIGDDWNKVAEVIQDLATLCEAALGHLDSENETAAT